MGFLLIPMILLNYIRNLKYLAPFSMIANIFMGVGLAIIFYYIFRDPLPPISRPDINVGFSSWKQLPLYFGTAIYAFEGIGMVS
jgi:proton-coupled amino acid transporter